MPYRENRHLQVPWTFVNTPRGGIPQIFFYTFPLLFRFNIQKTARAILHFKDRYRKC